MRERSFEVAFGSETGWWRTKVPRQTTDEPADVGERREPMKEQIPRDGSAWTAVVRRQSSF